MPTTEPGNITAEASALWIARITLLPTSSTRAATWTSSARQWSPFRTSNRLTTSRWAIPTASTASVRWPGCGCASAWACRGRTQSWPRSAALGTEETNSSFYYHYARLIEILAALEYIEMLASDPDVLSADYRARAGVNQLEGVGCSEAPRGTLVHHYRVDKNGLIEKVNLIIATGQNNLAMNRAVAQVARHYVRGPEDSRRRAQSDRGKRTGLRPVPELLDARPWADAAACSAGSTGRHHSRSTAATLIMAQSAQEKVLLIGYGNTLRGDDGVGPFVVSEVARRHADRFRALRCPATDARALHDTC